MILLLAISSEELNGYRKQIIECLNLNSSNTYISKILVFTDNFDHNLPKLPKVEFSIKLKATHFEMINSVKRIPNSDIIIYSSPFIKFSDDLYKINLGDVQNNVLVNSEYYIFDKKTTISRNDNLDKIFEKEKKQISLKTSKLGNWSKGNLSRIFNNNESKQISLESIPIKRSAKVIKKEDDSNREKKLDVIIISVNYNDYLLTSLNYNTKIFDNITVVTSEDDFMCQKICEKFNVNCLKTNVMFDEGAKFNKGKAINFGIKSIVNPDLILLLDADIIVTEKLNLKELSDEFLYTSDRWICKSFEKFNQWFTENSNLKEISYYENDRGYGFFQLFNHRIVGLDKPFPETFTDASMSDLLFRDKFNKRTKIDVDVIHLGDPYINWSGRKTERFLNDLDFQFLLEKQDFQFDTNEWGVTKFEIGESKYGKLSISEQITFDYHYSGWTSALKSLNLINSKSGIRFECFLEKDYCWSGSIKPVIKEDWVGILHIPVNTSDWYLKITKNSDILQSKNFIKSLSCCKGLFVFSDFEKAKIKSKLENMGIDVEVESLKHPTKKSENTWSFEKFKEDKKIIHVGWWMRDVESFYKLKTKNKKIRLRLNPKIETFLKTNFDLNSNDVTEIDSLSNSDYDNILNESVVFINLIDSVANNTIVECIERNTPIIVNRLPSVEEYLGKDYPLYYNEYKDIDTLITDKKVQLANKYLKKLKTNHSLGRQIEKTKIYQNISNVSTLFLPGDLEDSEGGIYNPGFTVYRGKNIFLPRIEKFSEKERGQNDLWKFTSAIPKIVETNDNYEIKSVTNLKINNWTGNRIEDFRIFEHNSKLFSNHVFVDKDTIYPVLSEINLEKSEMTILGKIDLDISIKKVEKNWSFISIDDRLYLIYSISPLTIFEVDINTLTGKIFKQLDNKIEWSKEGYISASTNPIKLSTGEILMGFHSRSRDLTYHQGFILFDENFEIIKYSKEAYLSGGDFDGVNKNVIYTMSIKEEENEIICFSGDGDFKSIVFRINKEELWKK